MEKFEQLLVELASKRKVRPLDIEEPYEITFVNGLFKIVCYVRVPDTDVPSNNLYGKEQDVIYVSIDDVARYVFSNVYNKHRMYIV